jgi:N-acyl-D-aspartate/D-glutamate deacylase
VLTFSGAIDSIPEAQIGTEDVSLLNRLLQNGPGIAVFDPATIQDHATFEKPRQLATGVSEVFVNGAEVVHNGVHTGAKPGRVVKRDRN